MHPKIQIIDGERNAGDLSVLSCARVATAVLEVVYGINHVGHDGKQSGAPDRSATLQHVTVTQEEWDGCPYHKVEMAYSDVTKDFVMFPVGSTRGIVANAFGSMSRQINEMAGLASATEATA